MPTRRKYAVGCKRSGYAFSRVGATIRRRARSRLPARQRTSQGTVSGCPPTVAGAAALWEPRTGRETGHGGRVGVTHNMRRVGAYGRVGWLVIGSKPERGGAPRQQVETQRYWSSGRRDLSGCSRPCLIAYYDCVFLGMDSRVANWGVVFVLCSALLRLNVDNLSERYDRKNSAPLVDGASDN